MAYGLTVNEVISALRGENVNISAGNLGVGRRDYRIRTVAEFRSPQDIEEVVVLADGMRRVMVQDLADVQFGYAKADNVGLQEGVPGIVIPVVAEPDANTLEVSDGVEAAVKSLNEGILAENGLEIKWLNDQRRYINGSIDLLKGNIIVGGVLASMVLLVYLRSLASTLIVATSIPISIVGAFIFMQALGTTLNIVSLAGIAFAVGMLVDNAIVVLENIDRHRKMGKNPYKSAYDGTKEVWGAVLASSLTTIAVFLPVVFLEQEAGLLFRDIAIAVTCAVSISLIVSITVIPMLSRLLFQNRLIHHIESKTSGNHESRIARIGRKNRRRIHGRNRLDTQKCSDADCDHCFSRWRRGVHRVRDVSPDGILAGRQSGPDIQRHDSSAGPFLRGTERNRPPHRRVFEPYYAPEGHNGYPPINRVFFMSGGDFMACGVTRRGSDARPPRQRVRPCAAALVPLRATQGSRRRRLRGHPHGSMHSHWPLGRA